MPRPRTKPDEDVLQSTARVLLRVGPGRFTLADVAREAGLSAATLVQRFGTKRGLLLAFAESAADRAREPFERARRESASSLGALRAALVAVSEGLTSPHEVANSLAVLLDDLTDGDMHAAAARHAETTESAIRALLDDAVRSGELVQTNTRALARTVQAAWNGAIIQWALRGSGRFEPFLVTMLSPLLPLRAPARRPKRAVARRNLHSKTKREVAP